MWRRKGWLLQKAVTEGRKIHNDMSAFGESKTSHEFLQDFLMLLISWAIKRAFVIPTSSFLFFLFLLNNQQSSHQCNRSHWRPFLIQLFIKVNPAETVKFYSKCRKINFTSTSGDFWTHSRQWIRLHRQTQNVLSLSCCMRQGECLANVTYAPFLLNEIKRHTSENQGSGFRFWRNSAPRKWYSTF